MNRRAFLNSLAGALLSTSVSLRLVPSRPLILPQYNLMSASYDYDSQAALSIAFEWGGKLYRHGAMWYARTGEYYDEAEVRLIEWMATVCETS